MKKSNKILSLLLAFAMIFTAVVPAFAKTNGTGDSGKPENIATFKVKVTVNGDERELQKEVDGKKLGQFVLLKKGETKWDAVAAIDSVDYDKEELHYYNYVNVKEDTLEKETTYRLTINSLDSTIVEDTKNNYIEFKTDKYGAIKDASDKEFDFKVAKDFALTTKEGDLEKFRVVSLNEEGKKLPNVEFAFVNLKNNGTDYNVTKTGSYIKGDKITSSNVVGTRELKTDDNGNFKLSEAELKKLIAEVTPVGRDGQKIVGLTVNDKLVAVFELTNIADRKAKDIPDVVLRKPAEASLLKVYVKGYENKVDVNNKPAPKALKDVDVKILQNETKYQGEVKFGKVLAETKTNEAGYAEIKNPEKIGAQIQILESDSKEKGGYYTDIVLYNKVTVSLAGYMTKEFKFNEKNTEIKLVDGAYVIDTVLYPEGYEFTNRISGPKRYDTSVEVARKTFDDLSKVLNIVIASGDNFADGLTAASLSRYMKAPIVLNGRGGAEKSVAQFVKDVNKATNKKVNIVLVGGNSYLSGALTNELEALGNPVQRIYGANRYETSAKVFAHIEKFYAGYVKDNAKFYEPFIASGENFADALVASVPAALEGRPILLVSKTGVDSSVKAVLARKDIKKAIVVGGTSSVSDAALAQISIPTERLSGKNRQLTSMKLAGRFFMNAGEAIVVDGTDFADALAAAQYGAKINAPVLLTSSKTVLGKDLAQYLRDNHMTQITIVGGTGSVSQGIEKEIAKVLGGGEIK